MTRAHVGVAALLSVLVGWFVLDAISSLVVFPLELAQLGLDAGPVLLAALWAGVVLPIVLYAVAVVVARRQSLPRFTLVLIVALTATAAVRLSLIAGATGAILL